MNNQENKQAIVDGLAEALLASVTVSMGVVPNGYNAQTNADVMRAHYLKAFEIYKDPKSILVHAGNCMIDKLVKTIKPLAAPVDVKTSILNTMDGRSIDMKTPMIAIGNRIFDLWLNPKAGTCSRLHALVFSLPAYGKIAVVDVGSLVGIETISRSSAHACESSLPAQRRALLFDMGETARLKMGDHYIIVNPGACDTCKNAKAKVSVCEKHVVCQACFQKNENCALCQPN